jgi:Domain of unknown function (DUF4157)
VSWNTDRERLSEHQPAPPPEPQTEDPAAPIYDLASSVGNRAFSESIARDAAGVLPSGEVHPAVQDTITSTRGGGGSLDTSVQEKFSPSLGDLSDVRVHTDETADSLSRSVSARAFATGTDVYFAKGEYNPGSSSGDKLIAHELAHVVQQRGAPSSGPLTVSNPGDALETEADSVADQIA